MDFASICTDHGQTRIRKVPVLRPFSSRLPRKFMKLKSGGGRKVSRGTAGLIRTRSASTHLCSGDC